MVEWCAKNRFSSTPILQHPNIAFPMKNVVLLGSTGSIGTSTIKVAEDLPDHIRLVGLAAGNNCALLEEQTRQHKPEAISIIDPEKAKELSARLGGSVQVHSGNDGLIQLATL